MRTRLALGAGGVAMALFGLLRLLQRDLSGLVDTLAWLAGGVLLHDAVLAPLTLVVTFLGARLLPPRARVRVAVAALVLVTVTVSAVPVLGRWGARPDNATLLDRNYWLGWSAFALTVLVVALLTPMWRRLGRGKSRAGGN